MNEGVKVTQCIHVHVAQLVERSVSSIECRGFESHPGSSFFLGKVTALGVLCCFALFVCLTLLASFFLPSHLSFKNMLCTQEHLFLINLP